MSAQAVRTPQVECTGTLHAEQYDACATASARCAAETPQLHASTSDEAADALSSALPHAHECVGSFAYGRASRLHESQTLMRSAGRSRDGCWRGLPGAATHTRPAQRWAAPASRVCALVWAFLAACAGRSALHPGAAARGARSARSQPALPRLLLCCLCCAAPGWVAAQPAPPPVPPVGVVGGVDYCALAVAGMNNATATGGSCQACPAATGGASSCCPACVNTVNAYLTSCSLDFVALNYQTLQVYATILNAGKDCFHCACHHASALALFCSDAHAAQTSTRRPAPIRRCTAAPPLTLWSPTRRRRCALASRSPTAAAA